MKPFSDTLRFIRQQDKIMLIFLILALLSSLGGSPSVESIDWTVIITLFALITTVNYWQYFGLFERIIVSLTNQFKSTRSLQVTLVYCAFISSMLITNDVSIIVLLALFLPLSKRVKINPVSTTILIIVAANLGSALTPLGNPQNMFLYFYYKLTIKQFILITAPIVAVSTVVLWGLCRRLPNQPINEVLKPTHRFSVAGNAAFLLVFLAILVSLFHLIPVTIVLFLSLIAATVCGYKQLFRQNYSLLFTFIFAFVFIGNLGKLPMVTNLLENLVTSPIHVFISSVLVSQIISNVPAAILLGHYTLEWQPLIVGVNIGGLGTLIASMASLIGYKALNMHYPDLSRQFLYKFTVINVCLAVLLSAPYVIYYLY